MRRRGDSLLVRSFADMSISHLWHLFEMYFLTWWSWGESNPRPLRIHRSRYDHSRVCGFRYPRCRVRWILRPHRRIFLRCQRSFLPSAVFPCRPPLLLLPGCSDQAPGIITGPDDSLSPDYQAARATRELPCLCVPRFGV